MTLDLVNVYLKDIGRHSLLTKEDEERLSERVRLGMEAASELPGSLGARRRRLTRLVDDGRRARGELVTANLRLVVHMATKQAGQSRADLLDIVQDGTLGLIRAAELFDGSKGFRFSTFASWWIRQGMQRGTSTFALSGAGPAARSKARRLWGLAAEFEEAQGRQPNARELAKMAQMPVRNVEELLRAMAPVSLSAPVGEDGDTELGDLLARVGPGLEEEVMGGLEREEMAERVETALGCLGRAEAAAVRLRFGLRHTDGGEPYDSVAAELGLGRAEAARALVHRGCVKLTHPALALDA